VSAPGPASRRDTIAAISTPPGRGGIGIVRVSGARAAEIAQRVLGDVPAPRAAAHRAFKDAAGTLIDEGVALFFPAPNSYTGEAVLELQGHGGIVVMQMLLAACLDAGARLAQPGEFTQRAFLEGRLDLAQAEAVADLIDAASREAARSAARSLAGEFSDALKALARQLTELRALTEAMLDFPEEEVDRLHRDDALARLGRICESLQDVIARSTRGSLLRSGIHVVLAGPPNVGKSSLLNRLAGEERAIVTPIAGTTRDALRESIVLDGVPVVLVDTAGLRESRDEIERLGMQRTRAEVARADIVLAVHDASSGGVAARSWLPEVPEGVIVLSVLNKVDIDADTALASDDSLRVSALTGQGIDSLRAAILRAAGWMSGDEAVFMARERHMHALERARGALVAASGQAEHWEFFAEELRLAHAALGEITGETSPDELLGEIFSRFCIGK
jgi:tRNA modification GTPase